MTKPFAYLTFDMELPRLYEAIVQRKVQALMPSSGACCEYAGPCVIGVLLPTDQRREFDRWDANDPSFANLANHSVFEVSDWEFHDWNNLQGYHDNLLSARFRLRAMKNNKYKDSTDLATAQEIFLTASRAFFIHIRHLITVYSPAYDLPGDPPFLPTIKRSPVAARTTTNDDQ